MNLESYQNQLPMIKLVMEIPIYRCNEEVFKKEERKIKTELLSDYNTQEKEQGFTMGWGEKKAEEVYWKCKWQPYWYNQVIGWVRLYASSGGKIWGEYWLWNNKKFMKRFRKESCLNVGKFCETWANLDDDNITIANQIRDSLIRGNSHLSRSLDLEAFDGIAKHVDWHSLLFPK